MENQDEKQKYLYVMRGCSGSGKSTYIKNHLSDATVCSADHFWFDEDGTYQFDVNRLSEAHSACKKACVDALERGDREVVVDNTNTKLSEMEYYVNLAAEYGYSVKFVRVQTPVEKAANRNVHGVPKKAVEKQANRMEDLPQGWGEEIVVSGV